MPRHTGSANCARVGAGRREHARPCATTFASTCRRRGRRFRAATKSTHFTKDVSRLRDDVDRLVARIDRARWPTDAPARRIDSRLIGIQRVLVKYGLDDIIAATHLLRPLRFLFYLAPRRRDRFAPLGERIRLALEELGRSSSSSARPFSTRRDLLPRDIADELAKLQDAVPPFPPRTGSSRSSKVRTSKPVRRRISNASTANPSRRRPLRRCTRPSCPTARRSSSRYCAPACRKDRTRSRRACAPSRGWRNATGNTASA